MVLALCEMQTISNRIWTRITVYISYERNHNIFSFLNLKMLFLMKKIRHHNVFNYHTEYKTSSVTLTFVSPDIFRKIDLKTFVSLVLKIKNSKTSVYYTFWKWHKTREKIGLIDQKQQNEQRKKLSVGCLLHTSLRNKTNVMKNNC